MTILIVAAGLLVLLLAVWLLKVFSPKINFYAAGLDQKFNLSELSLTARTDRSEYEFAQDKEPPQMDARIITHANLPNGKNI